MTRAAMAPAAASFTPWRWPLDLDTYDRAPALTPSEHAALVRRSRFPLRFGHWTPLFHQELGRLTAPIVDAFDSLQIDNDARVRACKRSSPVRSTRNNRHTGRGPTKRGGG